MLFGLLDMPARRVGWPTLGLLGLTLLALALPSVGERLRAVLVRVLSPLQASSRSLAQRSGDRLDQLTGAAELGSPAKLAELADENRRLRAQVAALAGQLEESRAMVAQLTGLRQALPGSGWVALPVRTVSRDAVLLRESVLTTKPTQAPWDRIARSRWATARLYTEPTEAVDSFDPAAIGSPVFWDQSLVGRVESTAGGFCRIQLVTDLDFKSSVEITDDAGRVLAEGVLVGLGRGRLSVQFVERGKADIKTGDFLRLPAAKSGLPVPLIVGRVTKSDSGSSSRAPLLEIEGEPIVDLDRLDTVLIVLNLRAEPTDAPAKK